MWIVCVDAFAYEVPALLEVGRGAGQLEVVDVDHEEELQVGVVKTRAPFCNSLKTDAQDMLLAMLLPLPPGIWVSVKRQA